MNDMGQIHGENLGHEVCSDKNQTEFRFVHMEMELKSYYMEMVAPVSSDGDIHDNIGTNGCNIFGRSGGHVIGLNRPGR